MALTDNVSLYPPLKNSSSDTVQHYMTPEQRVNFYANQEMSLCNQETTNNVNQENNQPSYSRITSQNTPQPRTMSILKLKIIPPFTKDHFVTKTTFETASNQCISAILRQFSPQLRSKLTISKTFTIVGTRRLHTFHIVAPIEASEVISRLQSSGIEMLGRTVIPQSDSFERYIPGIYPKHIPVRILQLPSLCNEQDIPNILNLPESTEITSLRHNTDMIDGMNFFNGRASAMIRVVSKEHEQMLREWSIQNHENGTLEWNGIPIYALIPALHQCQHCKNNRRPFQGHDIAWCRYAKDEKQQSQNNLPNNQNQALTQNCNQDESQHHSNQVTTPENSTYSNDETNMTQDDDSESNKDPDGNQVDIETNSETDDDKQQPWQTAQPRKTTTATKTLSQPADFKHTKRKARLLMAKNLSIQTPVNKKKKPAK